MFFINLLHYFYFSGNEVARIKGFIVPASNVQILSTPNQFFRAVCEGVKSAKHRYSLVSLYLGKGNHCNELIDIISEKSKTSSVESSFIFDSRRTLRDSDSKDHSFLKFPQELLRDFYLYESPSRIASYFPKRIDEIFGTQHMKIYIFDDTIIISGANLSEDYFSNRQDRYWIFHDCPELADYYYNLIECLKKLSHGVDVSKDKLIKKENIEIPNNFDEVISYGRDILRDFINRSTFEKMVTEPSNLKDCGFIVPTIQMGKYGIADDSIHFDTVLSDTSLQNTIDIVTPYFNVNDDLLEHIMINNFKWKLLTASPLANGFLGSKGLSGYIPTCYLYTEKKFLNQIDMMKKDVELYEWKKENNTFHAKGLWIGRNNKDPHISMCGSSNYGGRSRNLDLENQITMFTENSCVQQALTKEKEHLYKESILVDSVNFNSASIYHNNIPPWIADHRK